MRTTRPITVTLGDMQQRVEERVRSGTYASASEVVRAGLRALEREEATIDAALRQKVREALDDPSPTIPADRVFAELREHHAKRAKAASGGV